MGSEMKSIILLIMSAVSVASAQMKTFIYNAKQWSIVKESQKELLKGIVVLPKQKLKIDLNDSGQIVNIAIFELKSMNESKVDGHLE